MISVHIQIAIIFLNNFLINAQVLFIPVSQVSPNTASIKTPAVSFTADVVDYDFQEVYIKQSTVNSTEHLQNRKTKQITWLDDFGYAESVKDEIIQRPGFSSNNTVMSDTQQSCGNCECGLRFRYKIVGGVVTQKLEYPWIVVLLYRKRFICGGSLINDRYVITAAHCVHGFNHTGYAVRFHEFDRLTPDETKSFTIKISEVLEHPQYNRPEFSNDLALLKLDRQLSMSSAETPRPICLPLPASNFFAGTNAVAAGWGETKLNGTASGKLLKVILPIVLPTKCAANYKKLIAITKLMICAGFEKGGQGTCRGDSGGPLMAIQEKQYRLIGVTSFSAGCALPNYPGVYARVSEFSPWIKANTKDACYCT